MSRVAIVTDSASDLPPDVAASAGITVVPLVVNFGAETFRPNVNLTTDEFWARMTAPDAPFPTTAAASPGDFGPAFQAAFDAGADAVVCVTVSGDLSGTLKSATLGAQGLPDREIHVVDSRSASMGHGMLAQMGAEMAAEGASGARSRASSRSARRDIDLYVALDTLEYLKRGGRISGARAAIGTMLSIKPIITVTDGIVENAERVRTRAKARERVPRAADPAADRAGDRPAHHQRRRGGVPRPAHRAVRPRSGDGPDDDRRAVRRPAPRPGLRRRRGRSTRPDRVARATARDGRGPRRRPGPLPLDRDDEGDGLVAAG